MGREKLFNAEKFNYERIRMRHICSQPMFIAKSIYFFFFLSVLPLFYISIHKTS